MTDRPPLPQAIWDTLSPEAQAAVSALGPSFERRVADLEERLHKTSTNSSTPPSSDPPSVQRRPPAPDSGKGRGGPPGRRHSPRALVPPERLRQVIACKPPHGRGGGHDLHGEDPQPLRHQVAEVPPLEPGVDEDRLHRLTGPRGPTRTWATWPPGVPSGAFGPWLRAILSGLAGADRLGKRPIRQLASDLLGLTIATGMSGRLERPATDEWAAPVEGLGPHVREADSAPIDETSWKPGRDKAWLWGAVTRRVRVVAMATSRGADVAQDLLGTDRRQGVLSDRFQGSTGIKRRPFCGAHRTRDFQAMVARGGESAEVGRQ